MNNKKEYIIKCQNDINEIVRVNENNCIIFNGDLSTDEMIEEYQKIIRNYIWKDVKASKMENIKIGDIVELNSGGPKMTVYAVGDIGVMCRWFVDSGTLSESKFDYPTIRKIDKD